MTDKQQTDFSDDAEFVRVHTSRLAVLVQTLEELAEVIQALCKVIRAEGLVDSPTPVDAPLAINALKEELGDVDLCLSLLPEFAGLIDCSRNPKWQRWAARIRRAKAVHEAEDLTPDARYMK